MKKFNNRYFCKNIHRYFIDIFDIFDISVKSNYRYIRVYRYFDPWLNVHLESEAVHALKLKETMILRQVARNGCDWRAFFFGLK